MPASSPKTTSPAPYGITSLEAGLQVLRAIGDQPDQTVPQLAKVTGLTKSKVFRIVRTLEAHGFVQIAEDHTLRLGSAALILGKQAGSQYTLSQAAAPSLDQLSEQTRENVYLLVREGTHSVVIDLRLSPHPIRAFARVGTIGALHAGGAPKVLLAYAPNAIIEQVLSQPLPSLSHNTITDPTELRSVLADIRQQRFHFSTSDLQEQVFALAAPVFDHQGQVVAAISVAWPQMRFEDQRRVDYERVIRQASQAISQRLGA